MNKHYEGQPSITTLDSAPRDGLYPLGPVKSIGEIYAELEAEQDAIRSKVAKLHEGAA